MMKMENTQRIIEGKPGELLHKARRDCRPEQRRKV
jgi:hypothetical protein